MKTILVTGASGFIGVELVKKLKSLGFNVIKFVSQMGDISEYNFLNKYKKTSIDHIFHLASRTFVPDSWEKPMDFYKTSVLGTGNILELCRNKNISLTFVSAYLYGIPEKLPISEEDKIRANNPYAHSKYLAEKICEFYSNYYDVKITIARPFNVYGKNQKGIFLIPYIIDQVLHSDTIKVKDLKPKRDYIHISDLTDGLIKTLNSDKQFAVYNFGSGEVTSVEEIINIVQNISNTNKKIISEHQERKHEIMEVMADISKAKINLNWAPTYNIGDGIREILTGYQL